MIKVGIYGGSGYTGNELMRLLAGHPEAEVAAVTSRRFAGVPVSQVYPVFSGLTDLVFTDIPPKQMAAMADCIFLALPHSVSMEAAPLFVEEGRKVIDLSADFRLHDAAVYEQWYGRHKAADLLPQAAYGLPELHREEIRKARLIANPGCYPTSVILGLAPVLKSRWIDVNSVIADSKSGVSGAGREPQIDSLFCEVDGGFKAYKVGGKHRHTPEIEQELGLLAGQEMTISFTPHLLPVKRGILSTVYAQLSAEVTAEEVTRLYQSFYRDEPFVRVRPAGQFPGLSAVVGSNYCDIGVTVDQRTRRLIVVSVIDNLIKGASGQAIQNLNLLYGFPETAGLPGIALFP